MACLGLQDRGPSRGALGLPCTSRGRCRPRGTLSPTYLHTLSLLRSLRDARAPFPGRGVRVSRGQPTPGLQERAGLRVKRKRALHTDMQMDIDGLSCQNPLCHSRHHEPPWAAGSQSTAMTAAGDEPLPLLSLAVFLTASGCPALQSGPQSPAVRV